MLPIPNKPWTLENDFWIWAKNAKAKYQDKLGRSWRLTTDNRSYSIYWICESDGMRQLYLHYFDDSNEIRGHFFNEHEALIDSEIYELKPVSCEDCLNIKELTDKYLALSEILISSVGKNWLNN